MRYKLCIKNKNIAFIATLLVISIPSIANVSIRNGNFFIGYTDLLLNGGMEMKIERVYNSKSPFLGIFGWGWGSDIENYIVTYPDGSIVLHENGGGADNLFEPVSFDRTAKSNAVETICAIMMQNNPKSSDAFISYKQRLFNDRNFFNSEWEKLITDNQAQPYKVEPGEKLISYRFGYHIIEKTENGYIREKDMHTKEYYNNSGKLIEVRKPNNIFMKLYYDAKHQLERMQDDMGRTFTFFYNKDGLVDSIVGNSGSIKSHYQYNNKKELIFSADADKNNYAYTYDDGNRHNLVKILYSDNTTLEIEYYDMDLLENVRQVKDRDGTLTAYTYVKEATGNNESVLRVSVVVIADKTTVSDSKYVYYFRALSNGIEFLYRMTSSIDGLVTDTHYEENGVPEMIIRDGDTTKFRYNAKGLVVYKETDSEIKEIGYSDNCLKINRVSRSYKSTVRKEWVVFRYDENCNLVFAENSDSTKCELIYDSRGRISEMYSNGKTMFFTYNNDSKPIEIKIPNVGSITVKYNQFGEVEKVDSEGGRKIALQVTSEFQQLLELIRPAEVSFSF